MSVNGIVNINKPSGLTSFDVVAKLRKILKERRIGHTGTLDPDATGVLPVCVGKATGAVEFLMDKDKAYYVKMALGVRTDTGDASGHILEERSVNSSKEEIGAAIRSFQGRIRQVPPMYSAIKVGGKKLYELARKGISIERPEREVEIFHIEIETIQERVVEFHVHCSKGTYIRTLCEDIGNKLGCGAHMSGLIRTQAGIFRLEDSISIDHFSEMTARGELERGLLKVEKVFECYPRVDIWGSAERRYLNGASLCLSGTETEVEARGLKNPSEIALQMERQKESYLTRVFGQGLFLGLGSIIIKDGESYLKTRKFFV